GDEVASAEWREDLRELLAPPGDELEHEEERNDAGVGLAEVAEVVVAGHLAGEDGVIGAHARLDEGVPDAVDERNAAGALDRVRHGVACAHVVDDVRAGLAREEDLREESGDEVAGDELAGVVDEEAAVGVTVERDAEVGT